MFSMIIMSYLAVVVLMFLTWGIYLWQKNPGLIDAVWSLAILLVGTLYLLQTPFTLIQILYLVLFIVWGVRLSAYLFITRVLPGHIDKRYTKLSEQWHMSKSLGFLLNYQFQGVLAVIIATPFLFINQLLVFSLWHVIAISCVVVGIIGETIADQQLEQFKKQHPGEVCGRGLWQYSRHPNYFFEWLIWMGFAIAAISVDSGYMALISPLLLILIMLKITGPITERASIESRGEAYLAYQRKTPMFFPRLWKKEEPNHG